MRLRSNFGPEVHHSPQSRNLIGQTQSSNGLITGLQPTHHPSLNGFVDRADQQMRQQRLAKIRNAPCC
jgi:hypothetical protein